MSTPFRKKMIEIIITAVTIYLILLLLVFIFQRKVIYYPYKLDKNFAFPNYVPAL